MVIFYLVIISDVTNEFRSFFHSVHVFYGLILMLWMW